MARLERKDHAGTIWGKYKAKGELAAAARRADKG
jgi:hypothetical protein